MPYHALYATADEILCGLEGVDWVDANGDGIPDTCTGGLWSGRAISVSRFFNDEQINAAVARIIPVPFGQRRHSGMNYRLVEGDAYRVQISPHETTRIFLPPVR